MTDEFNCPQQGWVAGVLRCSHPEQKGVPCVPYICEVIHPERKGRRGTSVDITISVANFESIKISQYSNDFETSRYLAVSAALKLAPSDPVTNEIIERYIKRVFGRDYMAQVKREVFAKQD